MMEHKIVYLFPSNIVTNQCLCNVPSIVLIPCFSTDVASVVAER